MFLKLNKEEAWDIAPPKLDYKGERIPVEEVEIWINTTYNTVECKTYYAKPNSQRRSSFVFGVDTIWFDRLRPAIRSFVTSERLALR